MKKKNNRKFYCDKCRKEVARFKYLKKVNSGFLCKECIKENRKKHREFLRRDILGIRKKSDLLKEWAQKRKVRESIAKSIRINKPKIKSIKTDRLRINTLGLYLTKNERLVLYRKLVHSGLSEKEASDRVNNLSKQMKTLIEELRNKVKTQEELNKKFKEGFTELIGEIE